MPPISSCFISIIPLLNGKCKKKYHRFSNIFQKNFDRGQPEIRGEAGYAGIRRNFGKES